MKLKNGFITHTVSGQQIMVSTDSAQFSGMVRSNATAAYIVDCLKTDTTPEQITAQLQQRYDAPAEQIARDVERIIDSLRQIGAIDE